MSAAPAVRGKPSARFLAHQWLARLEVARASKKGWGIERDDALQAALIGLHQVDKRAPPEMPDGDFVRYASFRIRGAILDEIRAMTPEARRNRGSNHSKPRRFGAGHVEALRDAGQLALLSFDEDGLELTPIASEPSPEDIAARNERALVVDGAIKALPPRSRDILLRRLAGEPEASLAATYGVSGERINQVTWEAVRKVTVNL